jgi:CARDB
MNTVTPEKKEGILKALAVLGFLAIIGFIAWASVQIVAYVPRGFTHLASLAQSVNHYKDSLGKNDTSLTLTSTTTEAKAGEPVKFTWNKQPQAGTYAFSYKCTNGVGVSIVDTEGLRSLTCDTEYGLGDTDVVSVIVDSEKQTQTDVTYAISYTDENHVGPKHSSENKLTVMNPKLLPTGDGTVLGIKDKTEWKDTISNPTPKPVVVNATPLPHKAETTPSAPVSNATGYTDLQTIFLATGVISGNTFAPGPMQRNGEGAFQFAVTNLGTKTSQTWTYTVTLPDGDVYTSPLQAPLMPGEEATIALGFPTNDTATYSFVVVVAEQSDINFKNNNLYQTVTLTK